MQDEYLIFLMLSKPSIVTFIDFHFFHSHLSVVQVLFKCYITTKTLGTSVGKNN